MHISGPASATIARSQDAQAVHAEISATLHDILSLTQQLVRALERLEHLQGRMDRLQSST